MEAGFYVQQGPQVCLTGIINDVLRFLDGVINLPCVSIELYKIAAHPVVLPLLALLHQDHPTGTVTRGYPPEHPHSLQLLHLLAHPLTLFRWQGGGALKNFCAWLHLGVKREAWHQTHVTLPACKFSLKF